MLVRKYLSPEAGTGTGTGKQPEAANPDETGKTPGGQTPNDATPETGGDDAFDKDRAMATIKNLRAKEKELNAYKAAEEKRKREEMSEADRIKTEKAELEDKLTKVQRAANEKLARALVIEAAAKANFADPSDAWGLIKDSLEIGDDGEIANLKTVLDGLAKGKPYLLKAVGSTPTPQPSPANPGGGKAKLTADAIRNMTAQEIAKRWNDPEFQKELAEAQKSG